MRRICISLSQGDTATAGTDAAEAALLAEREAIRQGDLASAALLLDGRSRFSRFSYVAATAGSSSGSSSSEAALLAAAARVAEGMREAQEVQHGGSVEQNATAAAAAAEGAGGAADQQVHSSQAVPFKQPKQPRPKRTGLGRRAGGAAVAAGYTTAAAAWLRGGGSVSCAAWELPSPLFGMRQGGGVFSAAPLLLVPLAAPRLAQPFSAACAEHLASHSTASSSGGGGSQQSPSALQRPLGRQQAASSFGAAGSVQPPAPAWAGTVSEALSAALVAALGRGRLGRLQLRPKGLWQG